jgi:hypothetical protein
MGLVVKKSLDLYREQHFSHMNDYARAGLGSLFRKGDESDPPASVTISMNLLLGNVWHD